MKHLKVSAVKNKYYIKNCSCWIYLNIERENGELKRCKGTRCKLFGSLYLGGCLIMYNESSREQYIRTVHKTNRLYYFNHKACLTSIGLGRQPYRSSDKSLAPNRKETSLEGCQGRGWFQQHRDASCHQVFFPCKPRRRRKFTPLWKKH